jgi:DUF1365 family protein
MNSCFYEGRVMHRRHGEVEHRFRYSLCMAYVDLEELSSLVKRESFLSASRFAPASFLRRDHVGEPTQSLDSTIRELVSTETGNSPTGPIRVLTQLRYWGYYFSPLNLFYCFDRDGERVESIVAEVSNTPWKQKHCYVLWSGNRRVGSENEHRHKKAFHVSPFQDMDAEYDWTLSSPGDHLTVLIRSRRSEQPVFDAAMSLRRRPWKRGTLPWMLVKHPVSTAKIVAAIYFEAFRLWLKNAPFYPHPQLKARQARESTGDAQQTTVR